MIAVLFVAGALFAQAQPAATPGSAGVGTTVTPATVTGKKIPASTKDPNEIICKSEPVLGTLFPKKTCSTRSDLEARRVLDQQTTRDSTQMRPYRDPTSDH